MMIRTRFLAAMTAILLTAGVISAPAARADAATRAQLAAAVQAVEYENVGGPNYDNYRALYPTQIDWSNDGCSVPTAVLNYGHGIGQIASFYRAVFQSSCVRHDFGYRNYGSAAQGGAGLQLDPTESRRLTIDQRFKSNMKIQCGQDYPHWYQAPVLVACRGAADVFYDAVRWGGRSSFFG